jgi:LysM repeat protein
MIRFNSFRAKDPVIAAIVSMGLIFGAPAISKAQSQAGWEEVGPAGSARTAQTELMMAPPKVVSSPLGANSYRPPVEPPARAQKAVAPQAVQPAAGSVYIVQGGDTLPKIAMKVYGDPNRWQDLMVLNNIDNGNRIFVGQKLVTASANSVMSAANNSSDVPDHEIEEAPAPSVSADAAEADASFYGQTGGSYTVQRGDTLGKIAKRILGSSKRWREIARANPSINPNRLRVGDKLVIPGAAPEKTTMAPPIVAPVVSAPLNVAPPAFPANPTAPAVQVNMARPYQVAQAAPVAPAPAYQPAPVAPAVPAISQPSFDPPPLVPPPVTNNTYGAPPAPPAPSSTNTFAPPPAPPVYSGGSITPPPPPATSDLTPPPPPVTVPGTIEAPPAPYMSAPVPGPAVAPAAPVAVGTRELYREERYRIPDELKPTDFSPYFMNLNGYHGLFEVESALLPYIPTWHIGFHYRYEKYQYLNGDKNVIEGSEGYMPLHIGYTGKKMFAGLTVPFQNWEVKRSGGGNSVDLSGVHDPSLKVGYQVWKNLEGTHAVTMHVEGRFPGDNYHQPLANMTGRSRTGVRIGPAGATRGSWVEFGGAYSGKMDDKWNTHINMAYANNSEDSITKFTLRAGLDYRVNHNFALVSEINSESYEMDNGPDASNSNLLLGFKFFNDKWEGNVGFPMALESDFNYASDFGVIFGVNHRWD